MRNGIYTCGACAIAAALAACSEPPQERPLGPEHPRVEGLAAFTARITPIPRGPGAGAVSSAFWEVGTEGEDGNPDTNPPGTIQVSSGGEVLEPAPGEGACAGDGREMLAVPVTITNFLPERLTRVHVAFTNTSAAQYGPCSQDVPPEGSTDTAKGGRPTAIGYLNYVSTSPTPPRAALLGSTVGDGSVAGASATRTWSFSWPADSTQAATVRGEVRAEIYPSRPRWPGFFVPDALEIGRAFQWEVDWGGDDLTQRTVTRNRVEFCTAPYVDGACSGTVILPMEGDLVTAQAGMGTGITSFDATPTAALVPGQIYFFRAVNEWDHDGSAATPLMTGTLPFVARFTATAIPTLAAPALDENVSAGSFEFRWISYAPVTRQATYDHPLVEICSSQIDDASCGGTLVASAQTGISSASNGNSPETITFRVTVGLAAPLAPGQYYWRARNFYAPNFGNFTPLRRFTYSGP